jgi:electron transfer flavoprotein alpha subunit
MAILVLLDHEDGTIKQPSRCAVAAGAQLGEVHALLAGTNLAAAAQTAAQIQGVAKVLLAEDASFLHSLAEPLADLLVALAPGYSHILAASTAIGKNVIPRAAALLDAQSISDVSAVLGEDRFVRPIYAGNALATVHSRDAKKLLTIRAASFDPAPATGGAASIEAIAVPSSASRGASFVSQAVAHSDRPELSAARVVISGGRGMGSGENFALLEPVADALKAAIGASRAAVDAGYAPNDFQVGQTGKIVAPDLYIAVGISGAIQHLAGMKDSKYIVAINKDPEAPIFQIADYGLVADLFVALPELKSELERSAS